MKTVLVKLNHCLYCPVNIYIFFLHILQKLGLVKPKIVHPQVSHLMKIQDDLFMSFLASFLKQKHRIDVESLKQIHFKIKIL